jgi:hypothetical protein
LQDGSNGLDDDGYEDGLSAAYSVAEKGASQRTEDAKKGVSRDDGACVRELESAIIYHATHAYRKLSGA